VPCLRGGIWLEEDMWLEFASDWTKLAELFENEDRLLLN
jgi:hypothetical protein